MAWLTTSLTFSQDVHRNIRKSENGDNKLILEHKNILRETLRGQHADYQVNAVELPRSPVLESEVTYELICVKSRRASEISDLSPELVK
jgi:flagellar biosynthesis GTPase FlhF